MEAGGAESSSFTVTAGQRLRGGGGAGKGAGRGLGVSHDEGSGPSMRAIAHIVKVTTLMQSVDTPCFGYSAIYFVSNAKNLCVQRFFGCAV
jgi:hypothetical protein